MADYPHVSSGKVRDIYRVDDGVLLMVASDRISPYDHILPTPIPDKGRILTAMSAFWFELLADVVPNHVIAFDDARIPEEAVGRSMLVVDLDMIDVECVARGYLSGSGWADYAATGAVCGAPLPDGLAESARLTEHIFTPATKAALGKHDENISPAHLARLVGDGRAAELRRTTLAIYRLAADHAAGRGVLLADTKVEFGLNTDGGLVLADEVLTPDSSRYWPADRYAPGGPQASFDKQYVRDWLTSGRSGWDRAADAPAPELPAEVVAATRERYVTAYERISGRPFDAWPGAAEAQG
jgi:phosphoribosylaminoimidazole-succinocarboxamide synthase